jgi:hypothetical protein
VGRTQLAVVPNELEAEVVCTSSAPTESTATTGTVALRRVRDERRQRLDQQEILVDEADLAAARSVIEGAQAPPQEPGRGATK